MKRLTELGFANVRIEPFTLPYWERGIETAAVVAPYPQPLAITALGNSASTGPKGLIAPITYFRSYADLIAAAEALAAIKERTGRAEPDVIT